MSVRRARGSNSRNRLTNETVSRVWAANRSIACTSTWWWGCCIHNELFSSSFKNQRVERPALFLVRWIFIIMELVLGLLENITMIVACLSVYSTQAQWTCLYYRQMCDLAWELWRYLWKAYMMLALCDLDLQSPSLLACPSTYPPYLHCTPSSTHFRRDYKIKIWPRRELFN